MKDTIKSALISVLVIGVPLFSFFERTTNLIGRAIIWPFDQEVQSLASNAATQWAVAIFAVYYFALFSLLEYSNKFSYVHPRRHFNCCLLVVFIIGIVHYGLSYSVSSRSLELLTLFTGAALGKGACIAVCCQVGICRSIRLICFIVTQLILLYSVGSLCGPLVTQHIAQYLGHPRFSGPIENPNIFGLLMGTGITLSLGLIVGVRRLVTSNSWQRGIVIICMLCLTVLAKGLVSSFSRGAAVGTFCGVCYLLLHISIFDQTSYSYWKIFSKKKALLTGSIVFSVMLLSYWSCQQIEWAPVRRVYSMTNRDDFSWQNRTHAWAGALKIITDNPCFGLGWNISGQTYEHYYMISKVDDYGSIGTNDYLILGMALGGPALFCFVVYICFSLTHQVRIENRCTGPNNALVDLRTLNLLSAACRSGAIVLLIGFWFDGGLFDLCTASTFWILIRLGTIEMVKPSTF